MSEPQIVFQGRKFRVERRDGGRAGLPHPFDVVTHGGAAVILPVLDDGRIVLIHNYRIAVGAELLELPAGTIDDGEPPEACAARELAEETGYRAGKLTRLLAFYSSPGICTELVHSFLATDLARGATAHEAGERIRVTELPPAEALEAIRTGRIVDAKTIVTLLYYERFGGGGDAR